MGVGTVTAAERTQVNYDASKFERQAAFEQPYKLRFPMAKETENGADYKEKLTNEHDPRSEALTCESNDGSLRARLMDSRKLCFEDHEGRVSI